MKTISILLILFFAIVTFGCGGYGSSNNGMNSGATPSIMQLSPSSATAGGAGFVLTVNGSNLGMGSTVYWNSVAHNGSYVTGNQMTTNITAADIANPGSISVYVRANGKNSNTLTFTIN
jgi:hypothetical protein